MLYFTGLIIAVCTFLIIGFFHPIVIKTEYYLGTKPWWLFLVGGVVCIVCSLLIENTIVSSIVGVVGASMLWSIGEIFAQKKRVEKGWFPMNPKRRDQYQAISPDETLCPVRKGKTIYSDENSTYTHRQDGQ